METTTKSNLTQAERQANVDRLISVWKERKKHRQEEAQALMSTPAYQAALEELRSKRIARDAGSTDL